MNENPNHPDFDLIASRWRQCIADGSFSEWFDRAYPKPKWHWKLLFILSATVCLLPVAIWIFIGRVNRHRQRARIKQTYLKHAATAEIRLSYRLIHTFVDHQLRLLDQNLGYSRALVPADRVKGEYGWDSEPVKLVEQIAYEWPSNGLRMKLKSEHRLAAPFKLPLHLCGGRDIWVTEFPQISVQGLLKDPGAKSLVLPCLIPQGNLPMALPLPQFLIHDFGEIDQRLRNEYPNTRQIFAQIIKAVPPNRVIREFVRYLTYENAETFSAEEWAILTVHELEPYVRSEGLESSIAKYGVNWIKRWIDGLAMIGATSQYGEAKKILPLLEELGNEFREDWEYDDVVPEIDEHFPKNVKYGETAPFNVDETLHDFALAHIENLR